MKRVNWTIAILIANVTSGGTVRHAQEIVHAWSIQGCRVLYVRVIGNITHVVCHENGQIVHEHLFLKDQDGEKLVQLLKAYRVQMLHVEHLLEAPAYLLTLHKKLGIPLAVVMHDYYMICPFIKLTDENESYCGEKGVSDCQSCLSHREFMSHTFGGRVADIRQWRQQWKKYLSSANLVIVPSIDMEVRVKKYYPHIPLAMIENPELIDWHGDKKRIGIIGGLSIAKGSLKVKECLAYCAAHDSKLHFYLFGTIDVPLTLEEQKYITVLGPYDEHDVYGQISENQIDFFWFPGICPETYSYTLSIPIRLGIPCISTDLGAIASRIIQHHWGKTYPWEYGAEQIVGELNRFPYMQYKNSNFIIHNVSFGRVVEYYKGIDVPRVYSDHLGTVPPSDSICHIHGAYGREDFYTLWKIANSIERLYLLLHIDREWVRDVLQQKGINYFLKQIKRKYF